MTVLLQSEVTFQMSQERWNRFRSLNQLRTDVTVLLGVKCKKACKIFDEEQNIPKYHCSGVPKSKKYLLLYVLFVDQGLLSYRKCFIFKANLTLILIQK